MVEALGWSSRSPGSRLPNIRVVRLSYTVYTVSLIQLHSLSYTVYTVAPNSLLQQGLIRCRAKGCQPNRRLGHAMQLVRQVNPSLHVPGSALFTFFLAAVDIDTHEHD